MNEGDTPPPQADFFIIDRRNWGQAKVFDCLSHYKFAWQTFLEHFPALFLDQSTRSWGKAC